MFEEDGDILIEIVQVGSSQRVTAMDSRSLTEVIFQAPLSAHREAIERLARQKLAYRLAKDADTKARGSDRGGTIV